MNYPIFIVKGVRLTYFLVECGGCDNLVNHLRKNNNSMIKFQTIQVNDNLKTKIGL